MLTIKKIYQCCCGEAGFVIDKWDNESDEEICFSFWKYGTNEGCRYPWRVRLKCIWQILTKGHPFTDEIILNKQTVETLITDLIEITNKKIEEK